MLTRDGPEGQPFNLHAHLRSSQVFVSGYLRQVRRRHDKRIGEPLSSPTLAGLNECFEFHDASLVSAKPSCQAFASSDATKETEWVNLIETRRARLKAWFAKRTLPADEKSYLSQLIGGKSSFGEKAARRLEQTYGMPVMYLDTPPGSPVPQVSETHSELLDCWAWLLAEEKADILERIRPMAARNKAAVEQFAPPNVETRTVSVSDRRLANKPAPFANRRKDHG